MLIKDLEILSHVTPMGPVNTWNLHDALESTLLQNGIPQSKLTFLPRDFIPRSIPDCPFHSLLS